MIITNGSPTPAPVAFSTISDENAFLGSDGTLYVKKDASHAVRFPDMAEIPFPDSATLVTARNLQCIHTTP